MDVGPIVAVSIGLGIIWFMMIAAIFAATRVHDDPDD